MRESARGGRMAAAWLVIACGAALTFARALPYPLQRSWDDGRFILDNPSASTPSFAALISFFTERHFEAYHPLHLLSYWLDVPWFGPSPAILHGVSLVLWIAALWLLYACMRELQLTASSAVIGTLLVGLHPVQVEVVSWATGRKDVLAMLFACASLLLHLRSDGPWSRTAWASRALFLLAGWSKTTTLPLPLFALTLDLVLQRRDRREAWLCAVPGLVLSAMLGVVAWATWQENEMVRTTLGGTFAAPLRFAGTLAHQTATALWPAKLSPMYSTQTLAQPSLGMLAWPAAVGFSVWLALRARLPVVAAGLLGFVILLLPASNFVPMYFPLQDRYVSLPLLGLGIAVGGLLDVWGKRAASRTPVLLGAAACLALSARTVDYQGTWSSELRLWGHAASTQPDAEYAWLKLSSVRRDSGDLEGAIQAARALVRVAPQHRLAWAALLEATALRDERVFRLAPSRARELAKSFYERIDRPDALRELASLLLGQGYVRTLELPLACSLVLSPLPDDALEAAARAQLRNGRASIARFYASRMQRKPSAPELAALLSQPYFDVLP